MICYIQATTSNASDDAVGNINNQGTKLSKPAVLVDQEATEDEE